MSVLSIALWGIGLWFVCGAVAGVISLCTTAKEDFLETWKSEKMHVAVVCVVFHVLVTMILGIFALRMVVREIKH